MADMTVEVHAREGVGKNESRRLRKQGLIPAVLYGEKKAPVALTIEARIVDRILHSKMGINTVFELSLKGTDQKRPVMIKDYQIDPVLDRLIHADFIRIDATHEVHVPVHLELHGLPEGVKLEGGLLEFTTREIMVACLPKDIPVSIPVDVSALHVGQVIRAGDVQMPAGCRPLTDKATVVCGVHTPKAEVVETPAAEAVPVEGEVAAAGTEGAAAAAAPGAEASKDAKDGAKKPEKDAKKPEKGDKKPDKGGKK